MMSAFKPKPGKTSVPPVPQFAVRVTPEAYARLDRAAKGAGLSKTALIRQMVSHCLDDMETC